MEFRVPPEEERFRSEIRDFLRRELPADWGGVGALGEAGEERWDFLRSFQGELAGGRGLPAGGPGADGVTPPARTAPEAPKQKGISYFLLDMRTPGIEVRPLVDMTGRHTFNELFFDNVRVPRDCLIGEMNRAWHIAAATLDFERSALNRVVTGLRVYDELLGYAAEPLVGGRRLLDDMRVRHKLAELAIEFQAGRLLAYRVASMQARGQIPNAEASMSKLYGSELQQRLAGGGLNILGLAGPPGPGQGGAPPGGG